ncbi:helix-turn-helix domain-containing protein [Streptomyces sp. NPDC050400]|uniref:helix-turn-helix domain-containing protein n=1 Tax=Streptomyces sp. NPDC050400 TaxID=3365610 RepID=UPI00379C5DEA
MNYHGTEVRQRALTLLRGGARNADVARALNIPAGTIGHWKHIDRAKRGECPAAHGPTCPRCHGSPLDESAYGYLLGLYLGDGCINKLRSGTYVLRVTCANAWPGLIDACAEAVQTIRPDNKVFRAQRPGCQNVTCYSNHWPCLFPQHGPGKKHDRKITLAPWQQEIVDAHPWEFVRGLIHSDGCRITNWTTRLVGGERKRYEYPRYFFTNKSDCIRQLYTDTLDTLGIPWTHCTRHGNPYNISVARKAAVALMDAHVGPKH